MILLLLGAALAADRTVPPLVTPAQPLELPAPEVHALGGAQVQLVSLPGARKVVVSVFLERGTLDLDPTSPVASQQVSALMTAATLGHDGTALAELLSLHDIDVSPWVSYRQAGLDVTMPLEALGQGLEIAAEVLREPAFPKKDVARERRETLRWYLEEAATDPRTVANSALAYAWFPADHPYGARPDLAAWKKLRRGEIAARHQALLATSPVTVVVVGDVTWAELEPKLAPALAGIGAAGAPNAEPTFTPPAATRVVAVDIAGAEQTSIRLRMAAPLQGDPDRAVMEVVDFGLGGSFLSRLNTDLREEKGLTYGVRSGYGASETRGHWSVYVDVPTKDARVALETIALHVDAVAAEGLRADEIGPARNSLVQQWNEVLQTAPSAADFYGSLHQERISAADALGRTRAYDAVTPEETRRVASEWLAPTDPRVWVVAGDRATLEPQLEALGWPVEWISPEQAVLGAF